MEIIKESVRMVRTQRWLWPFGLFAVAGAGGGGAKGEGAPSSAVEVGPDALAPHALPGWLPYAIAGAVLVAVLMLALHVLSEAALIEGVRRARRGLRFRWTEGLSASVPHAKRVLGLKVVYGAAMGAGGLLVAAPVGLTLVQAVPLAVGVVLTVVLAVLAVPVLLSMHLAYVFALRFAVLDGRGVFDALRCAKRFLHGRLALGLKLLLASEAGKLALGAAAVAAALVVLVIAVPVYFLAGTVVAIAVFATLMIPLVLVGSAMLGTFQSAMFTVAYLEARPDLG